MATPLRLYSASTGEGEFDPEKARLKAEREARKEEAKAAKLAKAAKKEAEEESATAAAAPPAPVSYLSASAVDTPVFGDYEVLMSQGTTGRSFVSATDLTVPAPDAPPPSPIWLRGRVQSVRAKGSSCFIVLRQGAFSTVQVLHLL